MLQAAQKAYHKAIDPGEQTFMVPALIELFDRRIRPLEGERAGRMWTVHDDQILDGRHQSATLRDLDGLIQRDLDEWIIADRLVVP
jgi:hypothetical protein